MNNHILIGNIVSLASMVVIMFGGMVKGKSKFMVIQLIHNILCVICNCFLHAPTAVITASTGCIRDYLTYKKKMTLCISVVIAVITVGCSILCNGTDLFGYLPLVATVPYIFLIVKADDQQTKLLTIYIMLLWCFYDIGIQNYMGAAFDIVTAVTSVIGLLRIRQEEQNRAERVGILLADAF